MPNESSSRFAAESQKGSAGFDGFDGTANDPMNGVGTSHSSSSSSSSFSNSNGQGRSIVMNRIKEEVEMKLNF